MSIAPALKKPTVTEVHDVLRRHSALIVHFSGVPKGAGMNRGHLFPKDLLHVEQGHAMGGVSCSTVLPGDIFHGKWRNAIGCVGLVLDLKDANSLVAVSPIDCGSIEGQDGVRRVYPELDISLKDVENSIAARNIDGYNEWVLRDFKVVGVLAVDPFEIIVECELDLSDEVPKYLLQSDPVLVPSRTTVEDVHRFFPNLPLYTFSQGRITQFRQHLEIYV